VRKGLAYIPALFAALAVHLLIALATHPSQAGPQPPPATHRIVVRLLPPPAPVTAAHQPPSAPEKPPPAERSKPAPKRAEPADAPAPAALAPAPRLPAPPPTESGGSRSAAPPAPRFQASVPVTPITPEYPPVARIRGYEGLVRIEAEIDAKGSVLSVKVLESSGHSLLDDAAKDAVRAASFSPAERNGMPTRDRVVIPIRFSLSDRQER